MYVLEIHNLYDMLFTHNKEIIAWAKDIVRNLNTTQEIN